MVRMTKKRAGVAVVSLECSIRRLKNRAVICKQVLINHLMLSHLDMHHGFLGVTIPFHSYDVYQTV